MSKYGRDFELAVYDFAKSVDSSAQVLFDHSVRDRDTGELRQCDVWINALFGGHWPLSILVSCKDHKRKLHVGDIGAFLDEIRSTGASTGVIYSRTGFTKPSLLKARANGVACCRLYRNEPADIPQSIFFEQFTCNPSVQLIIKTDPIPPHLVTWNDIFSVTVEAENGSSTILELIAATYHDAEAQSVEKSRSTNTFPPEWTTELRIKDDDTAEELWINVVGKWKRYRARLEAHLLNGSYSLANESFKGSIAGPSIDIRSSHPGESWTEVTDAGFILPQNRILWILYLGNVQETLQAGLGLKPLRSEYAA
jgi:hypothetical protein